MSMTTIRVSDDEWYPWYSPAGDWGREITVPTELAARFRTLQAEAEEVQHLIREADRQ